MYASTHGRTLTIYVHFTARHCGEVTEPRGQVTLPTFPSSQIGGGEGGPRARRKKRFLYSTIAGFRSGGSNRFLSIRHILEVWNVKIPMCT
jgi:hypothetical protein